MAMENLTRRSFVGMAAGLAALAGAGASTALAEPQEIAPCDAPGEPDPANDLDMYRVHTTVEDLNVIRRQVIDACEDYTCEDGTVIPAVYVKMRMLVDGLGAGVGAHAYTGDESFEVYKRITYYDEELAQFYVNCPVGVRFNTLDAAIANDCDEAFAKQQLDRLAWTGAMFHVNIGGVDYYNHQRYYHGIVENSENLYNPGGVDDGYVADLMAGLGGFQLTEFPCYYPLPPKVEVMAEGSQILPYDDLEKLLEHHEIFAVTACQCRYLANYLGQPIEELPEITNFDAVKDFITVEGRHLEKCFTFGEEAQYYIEQGIGRQISRDEMRELINRSIDEGCLLQSCGTKYTEVICSCDKGCTNMPGYIALGTGAKKNYANQSHYDLMWDGDACIKCGLCADRCEADAVTMTGPDGAPEITGYCFRCGQCAIVCPVGARKLANKDPELIPDQPADLIEWINRDTAWRYEKGIWPAEMAKPAWQA